MPGTRSTSPGRRSKSCRRRTVPSKSYACLPPVGRRRPLRLYKARTGRHHRPAKFYAVGITSGGLRGRQRHATCLRHDDISRSSAAPTRQSTAPHHGHARRLDAQHQRSRARARAARPHVRVRGRDRCRRRRSRRASPSSSRCSQGKRMSAAPARGVRVARLRRAAARPRGVRPRPDPEGPGRPQDRPGAARPAAAQARQPALRRHLRPRQPAGAGGDPVQDQPRRRAGRRRERQARRRRSTSSSRRPARRSKDVATMEDLEVDLQEGDVRQLQRRGELGGRGRAGRQVPPEDPDRRDHRRASRTSTSSRTRSSTASATGSTAS